MSESKIPHGIIPRLAASVSHQFEALMGKMLYEDRTAGEFIDRLRIPAYNILAGQISKECQSFNNDPDKIMRLVEKICLRAFCDWKAPADVSGFKTRTTIPRPAGSIDLSKHPYTPTISRRDIAVPSNVVEVWQHQSNTVFGINPYIEKGMELFLKSEVSKQDKWTDGSLDRFLDMFYEPASILGEFSIPKDFGCWRARSQQNNAGGNGGMQGGDLSKMCTWSNHSREIKGKAVKPFLYVLAKGYGATLKNYEEILSDADPHATYGTRRVHGALILKEWKETGRSSALVGLDMITSLLMLISIITGNRKLAKKVGLFLKQRPWDQGFNVDPWGPVQRSVARHDSVIKGSGISWDDPRVRTHVKGGGTPWGFNAGADTMAWSMLGLNSNRDSDNLKVGKNMDGILGRLEWPEILAGQQVPTMSVFGQLRVMRRHAKVLSKALERKLPEVKEFNDLRNKLMHNAAEYGTPTIAAPDGWVTTLEPWSRNRFKGHVVKIAFKYEGWDGLDEEEVWVDDLTYNPMPNMQTAEAHTLEAWCMREFVRRFCMAIKAPADDVFDAAYFHGCYIELAMRIWTEILRDACRWFEENGSAAANYAAMVGDMSIPAREFTAEDIDPMCSVMNA